MRELTYLDFDVLVEMTEGGEYQARVVEAPAGQTVPVSFTVPFSELEVDNFLLRIGRPRRGPVRGERSMEAAAVREFGGRLFDAVFHDDVRVALATSLDQAEGRDAGLRVRLRLSDCPELVDLPWEYLYDRDTRRFLALSEWTPIVRYLQFPGRVRPLTVRPPLRVLVLIASSSDFPELDVAQEWEKLQAALAALVRTGRVEVERVPTGTLADLQRQLRRADYHVFHYIGHGGYDSQADDGVLILEGPTGRGQPVSGQDLGVLLHDHRTLRLAVLNSCEGARGGRTDPYSGTAQSLIRQGIPAVVAMQFEITDSAAITLAQSLYEAVADGYPLDAAMAEARKAVRHEPNPVEWGTPVLYMRAPDGRVFDLPPGDAAPGEPAQPGAAAGDTATEPDDAAELRDDPDYPAALAAFFTERWATAVELMERVQTRHPDHPQVVQRLDHAREQHQITQWDAEARTAIEQGRWGAAVAALEHLHTARPDDAEITRRLDAARDGQQRDNLIADIRRLSDAGHWAAVIAAGARIAELDPDWADPDGFVTAAKAELAEAELSDRYTNGLVQLDKGDRTSAVQIFAAIHAERPDYRDTAELLARLEAEASSDADTGSLAGASSGHEDGSPAMGGPTGIGPSPTKPLRSIPFRRRRWVIVPMLLVAVVATSIIVVLANRDDGEPELGPCVGAYRDWPESRPLIELGPVAAVAILPELELVVAGTSELAGGSDDAPGDGVASVSFWDLKTGDALGASVRSDDPTYSLAAMPDSRTVLTGHEDRVWLWDRLGCAGPGSGFSYTAWGFGASGKACALAVTPDGNHVVQGSDDGMVKLWRRGAGELAAEEEPQILVGHADAACAVAVTPDGEHIVSGSDDQTIKVWELATGENVRTLSGHADAVNAVAVTPNGEHIVSGSDDQTIKVWELATGEEVVTLTGHTDSVCAVAVDPWHVISGSHDATIKMWDLATGEAWLTLTGHTDSVCAVAVAEEGREIITGSRDATIKWWDLGTLEEVRTASTPD